jgi:hypothetical protein
LDVSKIGFFLSDGDKFDEANLEYTKVPGSVINPLPRNTGAAKRRDNVVRQKGPDETLALEGIKIKASPKPTFRKSQPTELVTPYVYIKKVVNPKHPDIPKPGSNRNTWNKSNNAHWSTRIEEVERRNNNYFADVEKDKAIQSKMQKDKEKLEFAKKHGYNIKELESFERKEREKSIEAKISRDVTKEREDREDFYLKNQNLRDITYRFFEMMKDNNDLIQTSELSQKKINYDAVERDLWRQFKTYSKNYMKISADAQQNPFTKGNQWTKSVHFGGGQEKPTQQNPDKDSHLGFLKPNRYVPESYMGDSYYDDENSGKLDFDDKKKYSTFNEKNTDN